MRGIVPGKQFVEITGALLANDGVDGAEAMVDGIIRRGGGVIFIDEAYQLTSSRSGYQVLDLLLAEMENCIGKVVFIFAGYAQEMETFFAHNPGLPDRVPYTLKFADYSATELLDMMAQMIHQNYNGRMQVEDGLTGLYSRIVTQRLASGRGCRSFGNARALQNMMAKITERQAERISRERRAGRSPDDFFFTKEDIIGPDPSRAIHNSQAWVELQNLTGLKAIKETVHNIIDMISANYSRELAGQKPMQVNLNRCLLGGSGTGKTTVGKLYGQILADIGILSNGEGESASLCFSPGTIENS